MIEETERVALITGAGSGLGRAIGVRLATHGWHVLAADIAAEAAKETAEIIRAVGGACDGVECDVTDSAQVKQVIADAAAQFGHRFDCLINNAGTDRGAGIVDLTDEQWNSVVAVNQTGPLLTTREFVRAMLERPTASRPADVVNVISISAITVGRDAAAYNCSKAALAMFTRTAQREAHEYRWPVRIHGLMPSAMDTPMMQQWHLAEEVMMAPDTVASAVEFMLTLPPDVFVQNLVINSRREPGWPR
jgi:NAD(P)-dependent dehydrogenase (short-subunit alcohol dehydrogenase family)